MKISHIVKGLRFRPLSSMGYGLRLMVHLSVLRFMPLTTIQ